MHISSYVRVHSHCCAHSKVEIIVLTLYQVALLKPFVRIQHIDTVFNSSNLCPPTNVSVPSKQTLYDEVRRFHETGSVRDRPKIGIPSIFPDGFSRDAGFRQIFIL